MSEPSSKLDINITSPAFRTSNRIKHHIQIQQSQKARQTTAITKNGIVEFVMGNLWS